MQSEIPEEIMMHAERLYDEGGYKTVPQIIAEAIMAERAALEAALSTDAEPVKALEWHEEGNSLIAGTDFTRYEICEVDDDTGHHFQLLVRHFGPTYARRQSLAEVKDVAQSDFEKRAAPALSAQVQDVAEYERREKACKETAMSQWERSLKRPDLAEKDRVIGAIEAYKRQAFVFAFLAAAPAAKLEGKP